MPFLDHNLLFLLIFKSNNNFSYHYNGYIFPFILLKSKNIYKILNLLFLKKKKYRNAIKFFLNIIIVKKQNIYFYKKNLFFNINFFFDLLVKK